jgi:hypothetical protein
MRKKSKSKYSKTINFKNHKLGLYDVKTFIDDWGDGPRKRGIKEGRCRIVKKNGQKVLEITIPKGTGSKGGSFWRLVFPKNLTDATFEYDIKFGKDFNFVRGGKLPGLSGGTSPGCRGTPYEFQNGFSTRLMWREIDFERELSMKRPASIEMKTMKKMIKSGNKSAEDLSSQLKLISDEIIKLGWNFRDLKKEPHKAYLVQYVYYPDRKTGKGDDQIYKYKNKKIFIEPEKWYTIKNRIKLSEDPKKNDTLMAWVNGKKALDKKLNLRKKKSYGTNQIMFSLFFGGGDETFATSKDEKIYFRKFEIREK